ncbi:cytochrome c oxidase assembly protein subunit 15 [Pseudokineococcus lusitanus]|uniref:Cytochrome c oxidase assembly protein subunit 15 n=1 Tax=Pseudokineococcus lusitanus TaxID=763993 RepID=A0A3N1HSD5_9ACTN|nr:cytochrome c oxidase assembly protein subunit 15 [Pseudokineococcus lusitanus]
MGAAGAPGTPPYPGRVTSSPPLATAGRPAGTGPARSAAPRWVVVPLVVNLVAQVGIVVTGGAVRLTGSGLGCPTWPHCVAGSYTPVYNPEMGLHDDIEFANRLLTFVVGLAAVTALVVVARLVLTDRRPATLLPLGAAPLVGVVLQAAIGGVTVLTQLHPATVAVHFLVSMGLVAASTALLLRVREGADGPRRPLVAPAARRLAGVLVGLVALVLALGTVVTGSGPHSGDAEHPARLGFDTAVVSRVHGDAVVVLVLVLVALLVVLARTGAPARARRRGLVVLGVVLGQGVVGWVQYLTGLPELLVGLHMLGAALLVVATTAFVLGLRERLPEDAAAGLPPAAVGADAR